MAELSEICRVARRVAARGEPLWLATVMRVRGSAYRHPGARLLFTSGQALAGSVSGGCLEASIVQKGPWLTREHPACIYFEGAHDEDDPRPARGTGCDGTVDILVERVLTGEAADPLAFIDQCLAAQRRGALITVFESGRRDLPIGSRVALSPGAAALSTIPNPSLVAELELVAERALAEPEARCRVVCGTDFAALLEVVEPAPHLFLFGSGPDAVPVAQFASALGLDVTVCDTTARVSMRERFAGCADIHVGSVASVQPKLDACRTPIAVVMSHHYLTDVQALEMLLASRAAYIGMLGPARRTARMLQELGSGELRLGPRDRARLRAPIGLDLGAETPAQIALSILAEIQAVLAGAGAESLSRHGPRPIHATDSELILPSAARLARTGSS